MNKDYDSKKEVPNNVIEFNDYGEFNEKAKEIRKKRLTKKILDSVRDLKR